MDLILKYFKDLTPKQIEQFEQLMPLYHDWNQKINVISRKDMDFFEEKHVLHSLAIANLNLFKPQDKVMDLGAGGGFPGVPLAIFYPDVQFTLVDSIKKKTVVMEEVVNALGLDNVRIINGRAEEVKEKFNYVVCRAVAPLVKLNSWCHKAIDKKSPEHGLICLKGGDLKEEINEFEERYRNLQVVNYALSEIFKEEFFTTKRIIRVMDY